MPLFYHRFLHVSPLVACMCMRISFVSAYICLSSRVYMYMCIVGAGGALLDARVVRGLQRTQRTGTITPMCDFHVDSSSLIRGKSCTRVSMIGKELTTTTTPSCFSQHPRTGTPHRRERFRRTVVYMYMYVYVYVYMHMTRVVRGLQRTQRTGTITPLCDFHVDSSSLIRGKSCTRVSMIGKELTTTLPPVFLSIRGESST
jgi:hypothetical protein